MPSDCQDLLTPWKCKRGAAHGHHQAKDHRTSQKLNDMHDKTIEHINYLLDIGQGRSQTNLSYNQILDHIEQDNQQDILFKFRAIAGHKGPLEREDPNHEGGYILLWLNGRQGTPLKSHFL